MRVNGCLLAALVVLAIIGALFLLYWSVILFGPAVSNILARR